MRSARHWAWTLPLPGLNWRPCLAMRGDSQPKAEAAVTTPAHGPLNFTLGGAGVGGGGLAGSLQGLCQGRGMEPGRKPAPEGDELQESAEAGSWSRVVSPASTWQKPGKLVRELRTPSPHV